MQGQASKSVTVVEQVRDATYFMKYKIFTNLMLWVGGAIVVIFMSFLPVVIGVANHSVDKPYLPARFLESVQMAYLISGVVISFACISFLRWFVGGLSRRSGWFDDPEASRSMHDEGIALVLNFGSIYIASLFTRSVANFAAPKDIFEPLKYSNMELLEYGGAAYIFALVWYVVSRQSKPPVKSTQGGDS